MQITIDLPDNLTDKIQDKLEDLSQKVLNTLAIEAFLVFWKDLLILMNLDR